MFDRIDKKKMWLVSKQIQRLLYLLVFLQKTIMLINTYLFQKELLVFYAKGINQAHVLNISVPEKIL